MSVAAPLRPAHRSYRAQWAQRNIREKIAQEINTLNALRLTPATRTGPSGAANFIEDVNQFPLFAPGDAPATPFQLPQDPDLLPGQSHGGMSMPEPSESAPHRLCIIGAGVTGLYIAMILDSLEIPDLTYEILEASERTGGRLYTHYFSKEPHDYYDIGAMRFPYIPIMYRTFNLFGDLGIPLIKYYLNDSQGAVNYPTMYNDYTTLQGETPGPDPFHVSVANKGSVPNNTVDNVDKLIADAFGGFKEDMAKDFEKGFQKLMKYDSYSTREYLKNFVSPTPEKSDIKQRDPEGLDFFTIQWLETNNTGSGLFDQAFSESVIDSFDFDAPQEANSPAVNGEKDNFEKWYCINGGTSLVTKAMLERIKQPVQNSKRVNKISQDKITNELTVHVAGEDKPRDPYTTVFNTTSLACLQRVDLTGLTLHPSQKDAIRTLHYDDSAKVAIQFSYPWWITKCGITKGGAASTDIPLRTCVYPSYNLDDDPKKHSILLCSYTWSQDATRIGSLIHSNSPDHEQELRELMISNLARLHQRNFEKFSVAQGEQPPTLDEIRACIDKAYIQHHAFSWSHDPYTSGAFALFGPGQFSNLYPYLSRPTADSRFHFCGEASSTHHAWIVGSLDSAVASVHAFLKRFKMFDAIERMKEKWGSAEEVDDKVDGTLHLQVMLGQLPERMMVQV